MEENKIAIIDIETTHFLDQGGLIVEVGIVQLDLNTGLILPLYNQLVKEDSFGDHCKDAWIFNNSDLEYEDILEAKPLDREAIQKILDKYQVTAYNKRFDLDFFESRGLKVKKELKCPMLIMTHFTKIPSKYGRGYKWPSVQESWDFIYPDSSYVEKHRGLDDAMHEAKIVYWLHVQGFSLEEDNI